MIEEIVNKLLEMVHEFGYVGIFIGMFLESTFVPLPSEIIMIPAGILAFQLKLDIWIATIVGIVGNVLGAMFNYYLAMKLGRRFIARYGKYVFFSEERLEKIERYFHIHGHISTFTGRLIPGVRHYISLPAGLARMKQWPFILYTFLGSTIWISILSYVGYALGQQEDQWRQYLDRIVIITLIGVALILFVYFYLHHRRQKKVS